MFARQRAVKPFIPRKNVLQCRCPRVPNRGRFGMLSLMSEERVAAGLFRGLTCSMDPPPANFSPVT
jgi:hypothetical protein